MITFVTAIYDEARPFIERLGLKKVSDETFYQYFASDEYEVVITGVGSIRALRNCSRHFAVHEPSSGSVVINVGLCGASDSPVGSLFLIEKITDEVSGKTYYPDLMFKEDFSHSSLTTTIKPKKEGTGLYDMEASAVYEASYPYYTLERIIFFKIVSDNLDPDVKVTSDIVDQHADKIIDFAKRVAKFYETSESSLNDIDLSPVISKFSLTDSMTKRLKRAVDYRRINRQDIDLSVFFVAETVKNDKAHKKEAFEKVLSEYIKASDLRMDREERSDGLNPSFTNVYSDDPELDGYLKDRHIVRIDSYKDIFNRSHQNFDLQKKSQALILSHNRGQFIYEGARVCQSFGNSYFYYCSVVMNCIFDCKYCYLAGMYPSGDLVVFPDFDDVLKEIDEILKEHPMYLCVSYDTDLLAIENMFGFVSKFIDACKTRKDLTIEVRTKSGNPGLFKNFEALDNVIFAWTLSPEKVTSIEDKTAPLEKRLEAMKACHEKGFKVRVCFDPMIYYKDWKEDYGNLVEQVFSLIDPFDVSIGVFRISTEYLKLMRKRRGNTAAVAFPFVSEKGVSHYGEVSEEMISYMKDKVSQYIGSDRIFIWEEQDE